MAKKDPLKSMMDTVKQLNKFMESEGVPIVLSASELKKQKPPIMGTQKDYIEAKVLLIMFCLALGATLGFFAGLWLFSVTV